MSVFFYLAALCLWGGLAVKLPSLKASWRDPLICSVGFVLGLAGAAQFFSAPPSVAFVNRLTGIQNVTAPIVYGFVSAFSAACLVLIIHWRGGEPARLRRITRNWVVSYALVIVGLGVLFALGDTPVERRTDLDTYYATTPFIREMIVLYLASHMIAAVATTVLCWRWSRQVHGWVKAGLISLAIGWILNLIYGIAKLTAVAARWTGRNWDELSTSVAPQLITIAALFVVIGFLLPMGASEYQQWSSYFRLGPLWRAVVDPADREHFSVAIPLWSPAELYLTRRETHIHDGLGRLTPYLDPDVQHRAQAQALAQGASASWAGAIGAAAMVAAATGDHSGRPPVVVPATTLPSAHSPDRAGLVRISRALRSPIADAAGRRRASWRAEPSGLPNDPSPAGE
ncbi:MAB_1171c family putative transporter [Streptomyces sp. NBC_00467]|uniref:MAB_1171c family putative transporter n=1 Tax=Streptomyces sp. NBC_00467 TaxID=2975752 RepID=UPI002E190CD0